MTTITAVLETNADGTVHLPVPEEMRAAHVRVTATLEVVPSFPPRLPRATPEMLRQRAEAFARLRELNPFRTIADPSAWQSEIRQDRPLLGRE